MTSRILRSAMLPALAALLFPHVASAQMGGSFSGGASCYQGDWTRGTGTYTTPTTANTATSWSSSCTMAGGRASTTASATNGILKIAGQASMDENSLGLVSARGSVSWNDQLKVISGTATSVRFEFTANGLLAQTAWKSTETTVTNTVAVAGLSTYYWNPDVKFGDYAAANGVRPVLADISAPQSGKLYMDVNLAYGMYAGFGYTVSIDAYLYAMYRQFVDGPYTSYGGNVLADFGNTAGLTGVTFFDANGNQVRDVEYEFQNGTRFYNPNATLPVPEPQTAALVFTGLLMLAAAARSRARA